MTDERAPGWEAVDAALATLYPGQEAEHYGTILSWRLGGPDPLDGVSVYRRTEPVPHLHFVTYGLSELYGKDPDADPAVSGYGFELTFRLVVPDPAGEVPMWPISLLQNLARYVFGSGNVFRPGEYLTLNGPIALGRSTLITEAIFTTDPELPPMDTEHGSVTFVQVVGVTAEESLAGRRWRNESLLGAMAPHIPLYVTDLARSSLTDEPDVARAVAEGLARDGSSSAYLLTDVLAWHATDAETVVTLGAQGMAELLDLLPARLSFGREYALLGTSARVDFAPGEADAVEREPEQLRIRLSPATLAALPDLLPPRRGSYPLFPGLTVEVLPSEIRDQDGNVTSVIG